MKRFKTKLRVCIAIAVVLFGLVSAGLVTVNRFVYAQTPQGFPDGFDAVKAAPASHKVIFENEFIRVLQVTLPPKGATEPMHHHRWPSLFLGYDTGGTSPHIRYHTADGKVRDQPSHTVPFQSGVWTASWMRPEPMHAIEVVDPEQPGPGAPPGWLRIEIKCAK